MAYETNPSAPRTTPAHDFSTSQDNDPGIFSSFGATLFGGGQRVEINPAQVDTSISDAVAQRAIAERGLQQQLLAQQQQQALSTMSAPELQRRAALGDVMAARSVQASSGAGSNRALAFLGAPSMGQQQMAQAQGTALSDRLSAPQGVNEGQSQAFSGDMAARGTSSQLAQADQEARLAAQEYNAGVYDDQASREMKNAGKFASLMAGIAGGAGVGASYAAADNGTVARRSDNSGGFYR